MMGLFQYIDWSKQRLLVVAPHVDDEIHAAGLLLRAREAGAETHVVALAECSESLPDDLAGMSPLNEFLQSMEILGAEGRVMSFQVRRLGYSRQNICELLTGTRLRVQPTIVCCPSSTDVHQDHQTVYWESMRVFRNVPLLLGWESPNNQRVARTDTFVELTPSHLDAKCAAFSMYRSQAHRVYFNEGMIRDLAGVRGRQARTHAFLAEAYEHLSMTL